MDSKVYFANLRAKSSKENTGHKVTRLFDRANIKGVIGKDDLTAIKLHFGEKGNDAYISPLYVRQVVKMIKEAGGRPFLTDTKKGRIAYINFVMNVSPDCDCCGWTDAPIVPDVGILASLDPVAIDQASFDLVNKQPGFHDSELICNHEPGKDKFKGMRPDVDAEIQTKYGEKLGMGSRNYELINI